MNFEVDRPNDTFGEPSLAEMVEKAIQILEQDEEGFFLYVEGDIIVFSQIMPSLFVSLYWFGS